MAMNTLDHKYTDVILIIVLKIKDLIKGEGECTQKSEYSRYSSPKAPRKKPSPSVANLSRLLLVLNRDLFSRT